MIYASELGTGIAHMLHASAQAQASSTCVLRALDAPTTDLRPRNLQSAALSHPQSAALARQGVFRYEGAQSANAAGPGTQNGAAATTAVYQAPLHAGLRLRNQTAASSYTDTEHQCKNTGRKNEAAPAQR